MNKYFQGALWSLIAGSISLNCWGGTPLFLVTPVVTAPSPLAQGQTGTAIYQITNNTCPASSRGCSAGRNFTNISLTNLPNGVTQAANPGVDYCSSSFNLTPGAQCLIKLQINTSTSGNIQSGPKVCFPANRPIYCSQPLQVNQLAMQVTPGPASESCQANVANFNGELSQTFDSPIGIDPAWGPQKNTLPLSTSNPNLSGCPVSAGASWQQQRVLAAIDFWIKQKLNYCEHHVPDYQTSLAMRGNAYGQGGYCNPVVSYYPGSFYGQHIRWNYSGTGSETASNWVDNGAMWYGFDCSNFTAFVYDFALGINFSSGIPDQAGQRSDELSLTPNQQVSPSMLLDNPGAAGALVCQDNTTEVNHSCTGHGGYISTVNSSGTYDAHAVTPAMLNALHPGDLIFIAGSLDDGSHSTSVTHVIMWTGKQIGSGIPASQIAPDELCLRDWQPQTGGWVIADSHYQGPDYRMITQCFYLANVWGVRRVIQ